MNTPTLGYIVVSEIFIKAMFTTGFRRGVDVVEDPLPETARVFCVDVSARAACHEVIVYFTGREPRQYRPRYREVAPPGTV